MSGAAGRRDTPAARAALARRRQRAAQTISPDGGDPPPSFATVTAPTATAPTATAHTSKLPPPSTSSRPRLTIDTRVASQGAPPPRPQASSQSTNLTKRAHEKRQSPQSATQTTAGGATIVTPPSFLAHYGAASPKDAFTKSQQAADHALSVMNAVNVRTNYRSRSPVNNGPPPASSPSRRVVQQEDLLLQSKRRRQALESRHRPSNTSAAPVAAVGATPTTTSSTPATTTTRPAATAQSARQMARTTPAATATATPISSRPIPLSPQRPSPKQDVQKGSSSLRRIRQLRSRSPSPNRPGTQHLQAGLGTPPSQPQQRSTPQRQRLQPQQQQQQRLTPPRSTPPRSKSDQPPQGGRLSAGRPTPLQVRAMQQARRSQSPQYRPRGQHNEGIKEATPLRFTPQQQRTPSLIDVLMDSSFQDASTLADITLHQLHGAATPRNANTSTYVSPGRPLFSDSTYKAPMSQDPFAEPRQFSVVKEQSETPTVTPTWDPTYSSLVDAAVLCSGSVICLRSYCESLTLGVVSSPEEKYLLASLIGVGLGRPHESLTLQKVVSTDSRDDTAVVRHGDTVMLYSAIAGNLALGSRKFVHSSTGTSKIQLGFFGQGGKAELWSIFPARPDQQLLVGPAALANPQKDKIDRPAPLRSSDPIILRNAYNGGILSIDSNGQLVLVTDSYQHDEQYSEDPSLLGRLQQHTRLLPRPEDTFQMILAVTPPCPPWVAQGGSEERIFMTGSYFLHAGRNQPSIHVESELFAGKTADSTALHLAQRYMASDENLSPKTKERILMDEVIGSFLGLEGVHIRLQPTNGAEDGMTSVEFRLVEGDDVTFDVGLRNLVDQTLPLSTSFVRVRNFVSSRQPGYEYGRVMQAFCEALDALLQDYVNFVSQLEWELRKYSKADTLTMKSIYFQASPSIHSMSILEHATEVVAGCKGGELINTLWALDKRSYMGDTVAKKVLGILLEKASQPYMEIMSDWLQTGRLNDPSEEFMVQRSSNDGRTVFDGDSWRALFQINEKHVLQGIAPNNWTKDKILTTGKYWNAVQECHLDSKDIERPTKHSKIPSLPFNSDSSAIAAYIDAKYQTASKVLVRILLENFKVMESLQIMKRYFLVDQGDFLMHFLDAAEQELLKPRDEISMGRLQHWLKMSVQLTEAHKEDWGQGSGLRIPSIVCPLIPGGLRCRLSDETLVSHLDSLYGGGIADNAPVTPSRRAYGMSTHVTGIEVFTIDFPRVPFPISLLMSHKAMEDYKLLFRHLFFTKHVERRLIGVWKDNQLLKKLGTLRGPLGPTYLLRQKMLHFVQNLIYFMVFEVVESNWMDMRNAFDDRSNASSEKPQTVDDMLEIHDAFLERTLGACLLTNSDLIRSLTKLLNTCLLFTDQMRRFMDTTKIYDDSLNLAAEKRGVIQRNLNERGPSQGQPNKRALRQALSATREERQMIQNRQTRRVAREVNSDSYQRMVHRFDEVFSQDLGDFMNQLNANASSGVASNLGIRLDYNGYVTGTVANRGN